MGGKGRQLGCWQNTGEENILIGFLLAWRLLQTTCNDGGLYWLTTPAAQVASTRVWLELLICTLFENFTLPRAPQTGDFGSSCGFGVEMLLIPRHY